MPVVQIEALPQPDQVDLGHAMRAVREAVASGLECDPGVVWVTWRTLDAYLCHDQLPESQPRPPHPPHASHDPILRIIAFEGRDEHRIAGALQGAATVLAGALGLNPGGVFAIYEEGTSGRVCTGGEIRRAPAKA
ncbi:MAG: hypothetical protein ACF8Q5_02240 [Phycisphaerales bacterium JB040]